MPIFMDRHDIRDASAEAVAEAHQKDLAIQHKHSCKGMTYWYDGDRGTVFCLIEAPSADAVREMHREAHGLVPNEVIEVDPKAVLGFMGRVADPAGVTIEESGFRALVFTDMAGSTKLTNELGDDAALEVLRQHHEIVLKHVQRCNGHEVDRAGDGFLLSFASVGKAVECGIAVQKDLVEHNRGRTYPILVRIGIGAGEPVAHGKALFGSVVNLTARVCDRAAAGEILATGVVRDLCQGKAFAFSDIGSETLKGFDEPVRLFKVDWETAPKAS